MICIRLIVCECKCMCVCVCVVDLYGQQGLSLGFGHLEELVVRLRQLLLEHGTVCHERVC